MLCRIECGISGRWSWWAAPVACLVDGLALFAVWYTSELTPVGVPYRDAMLAQVAEHEYLRQRRVADGIVVAGLVTTAVELGLFAAAYLFLGREVRIDEAAN